MVLYFDTYNEQAYSQNISRGGMHPSLDIFRLVGKFCGQIICFAQHGVEY